MGATSGTMTYKLFYIKGEASRLKREEILDYIRAIAFKPIDPHDERGSSKGWVVMNAPLSVEFTIANVFWNNHVNFAMREDKFVISPQLLNACARAEVERVRVEEKGGKALTVDEKRKVKKRVALELQQRTIPRMSTTDISWDLRQNRVRVFSHSASKLSNFRELFGGSCGSLGLELVESGPYRMMERLGFSKSDLELIERAEPALFSETIYS